MFSRRLDLKSLLIISFVFGCFALAIPFSARANEKKAEGGGEAKKEGEAGGEAKEGEGKAEGKSEPKRDSFGEVQGRVSTLQAKIKASEETIRKLIEEKQHTTNAEAVSEIIKNMVNEHKTLQKNIEDYDQARSYLQYRFPEKGLKGERQYERIELKSLVEMESEAGLDSRIKRTLRKVRTQYKAPAPRAVQVESRTGEAAGKDSKIKKPDEGPSISDPVILTK